MLYDKPILQVEDSDDDARMLVLAFKKAGITNQIITVPNGEEAVCYFKGTGAYADRDKYPLPGVLLLDLKLPGINGFDLLELLIKESFVKGVLIVVISGHTEIFQVNRAYAMGAKSFLTKPIEEAEVANLIKAFQGYWTFEPR
jgi:DNA-binding response OmpR family regulator